MVRLAIAAGIGADTLSAKTVSSVTRPVVALQGTPFHAQHGTVDFQPESPGGLPRADFTASKAMLSDLSQPGSPADRTRTERSVRMVTRSRGFLMACMTMSLLSSSSSSMLIVDARYVFV
jgi:hypothetical protein